MRLLPLALFASLSFGSAAAVAGDITGAGSTFAYPIFSKWATAYKAKAGTGLNYQAIGSGGGIKQISEKTVDFGATDKPLTKEDLEAKGLAQFPAIMGGVVPVINLKGITPGQIKLSGDVLANIYLGKIKQWNDAAIVALNPSLKDVDENITVVRRADGSGTTFIFTNYLSKVSDEWKSKVGSDTTVAWPEGVAGKGNAGVASYVQRINGSIGYVEYAYAKTAKMAYAQMKNRDGQFVLPDDKTFQATVTLVMESRYRFPKDSSLKILTSGLLGEQYIGVEAGADDKVLAGGDTITTTQSAVVLENLIGQFLYNKAAEGGSAAAAKK